MTWSGASSGEHFVASNPPTGSYGITSNVKVGPSSINLQSEGADMTGANAAANDAVITAAIAKLPNGGGRLYVPAGTVLFSAAISGATAMKIVGDGPDATVMKWGGAINSQMVKTDPGAGANVFGFNVDSLCLDANNVSGVTPLLLQSWQKGQLLDVLLQNITGGSTPALRMEVKDGTSSTNNTEGNHIRNLRVRNAPVAVQLAGQLGGSTNTYVTNNRFYGLVLEGITSKGIRAQQWCDSNALYGTQIQLLANNAVGVVMNDSATPAADVGVYNVNFYHLSVDGFGYTGLTGVLMNVTKQFVLSGYYHSPVVFPGTLISDNSGRALSYWILMTQDNASTNNMVLITKGFLQDTGSGAGGGTYANWINQTVTTTGNSPVLSSLGSDANVDMQVKGQGTGKILVGTNFANFMSLNGAAAALPIELAVHAASSDTNVDVRLSPKGTGVVDLNNATVALGGGAAPTLGTIGGSGPAAAAQNSWMKVKIAGTVSYIPVWR